MAAFLKLEGLDGEATDSKHDKWIKMLSMSAPIFRSITEGASDADRGRGTTTLGDIVIVRKLDKSSPKLAEACATGKPIKKGQIDFCAQANDKEEPYLQYTLENVIVSSYSFHGDGSGSPVPTEEITINFTKIEWKYVTLDPKTLDPKGNVVGKYDPGAATA
jgi:type VI secretion system secreted protein Hcp